MQWGEGPDRNHFSRRVPAAQNFFKGSQRGSLLQAGVGAALAGRSEVD